MTQQSKNILTGFPVVIGLIVVTVASMSSTTVPMQATILSACYVPDVGVIYRIKAEGLPDVCTEPTHVEFSWNMEGPAGPQGATGAQGATGSPGPAGISGLEYVSFHVNHNVDIGYGLIEAQANCPSGKSVIGGNAVVTNIGTLQGGLTFAGDFKVPGMNSWKAKFYRRGDDLLSFTVTAICANVD